MKSKKLKRKELTLINNKIEIDIENKNIIRLWTRTDEDKEELVHLKGFFLEERYHDWQIKDNILYYSSRIAQPSKEMPVNIVIEYIEEDYQNGK